MRDERIKEEYKIHMSDYFCRAIQNWFEPYYYFTIVIWQL